MKFLILRKGKITKNTDIKIGTKGRKLKFSK